MSMERDLGLFHFCIVTKITYKYNKMYNKYRLKEMKVSVEGSKFIITINQFEIASVQILQLIIDEKLKLTSYGVSGISLENIFLKAVGN